MAGEKQWNFDAPLFPSESLRNRQHGKTGAGFH